jgi:hypothetical protein
MTAPPAGTQFHVASIIGTWNPGSVPELSSSTYPAAQAAATKATRLMLGMVEPELEFHVVATDYPGGPVYRTRWRVRADVSGPTLGVGPAVAASAQVNLLVWIYPHTEVRQVVADPEMPDMPYRGVFGGVLAALLLRDLWGAGVRAVTLPGFGSGSFEPELLRYRDIFNSESITVPYEASDSEITSYVFVSNETGQPSGMWLATGENPQRSWQISYCVSSPEESIGERWDTMPQSVPAFEPLDWPS